MERDRVYISGQQLVRRRLRYYGRFAVCYEREYFTERGRWVSDLSLSLVRHGRRQRAIAVTWSQS